MDIYSLKIFESVAKTLNFTKTAQTFFLTQPVISRRIRELETELGCELFLRNRHGVTLTKEGLALLPYVQTCIDSLEDGIEAIKDIARSRTSEISIAAITPATNSFLPAIIGEYGITYPEIKINVLRMVPAQLRESLVLGSHDVYISSSDDIVVDDSWEIFDIRSDDLGLIVRKSEPVTTSVEALDFLSHSRVYLIPIDDSPALTKRAKKALLDLGMDYLEQIEIRPIESLMFNVASGIGVSVLPDNIMPLDAFHLKWIPLNINEPMTMQMAWRKDAPAHIINFVELIKTKSFS